MFHKNTCLRTIYFVPLTQYVLIQVNLCTFYNVFPIPYSKVSKIQPLFTYTLIFVIWFTFVNFLIITSLYHIRPSIKFWRFTIHIICTKISFTLISSFKALWIPTFIFILHRIDYTNYLFF